ncbi:uncharacterized protein LOC115387226 [Salarias fasciatus]|uniref:uncharacterized protein LOC115387226 n=1 Tax=Salarias fasciatus TaxID=181472 RepID=UPI00117677F3|nr:uncharacterized protein LOC115387226 [Salarias fasciatus]
MVKTAAGVVVLCVALLHALSSVSAVQWLDSINDLKRVGFGRSVPKQGLLLLHWFANIIDFKYDAICLTFDPNNDFGSHHYGNYDDLLPTNRYRYYTVGNIHKDTQQPLPDHIINPRTSDLGGNSARIIFSVRVQNVGRQSRQVIDEVYLTQHHGYEGSDYDGRHMYRITANLLRQIRSFPMNGDYNSLRNLRDLYRVNVNDNQLWNIRHEWGGLACLGLLLFIVLPHININVNQSHTGPGHSRLQSDNSRGQTRTDTRSSCNCINVCLGVVFILFVLGFILGILSYLQKI